MAKRSEEISQSPEFEKIKGPVFFIGGSGNVGFGLVRGLRRELGGNMVAVGNRSALSSEDQFNIDILDVESLKRAIDKARPKMIFHLAAATNVNRCEQEPEWARKINVEGTKNVVNAAGEVPVYYFSTDFVFSGLTPELKTESDHPDPISVYGQTKYEGEMAILESGNPGGIIRISFPWYPVRDHLANDKITDTLWWIRNGLLEGKTIPAFSNISANWTSMTKLELYFKIMVEAMRGKNIQILHLSGEIPATPFQVATSVRDRIIKVYKDVEKIGQVKSTEFVSEKGKTAPRPQKGGLDSSLAQSLGWQQPGILEMIASGEWL